MVRSAAVTCVSSLVLLTGLSGCPRGDEVKVTRLEADLAECEAGLASAKTAIDKAAAEGPAPAGAGDARLREKQRRINQLYDLTLGLQSLLPVVKGEPPASRTVFEGLWRSGHRPILETDGDVPAPGQILNEVVRYLANGKICVMQNTNDATASWNARTGLWKLEGGKIIETMPSLKSDADPDEVRTREVRVADPMVLVLGTDWPFRYVRERNVEQVAHLGKRLPPGAQDECLGDLLKKP